MMRVFVKQSVSVFTFDGKQGAARHKMEQVNQCNGTTLNQRQLQESDFLLVLTGLDRLGFADVAVAL